MGGTFEEKLDRAFISQHADSRAICGTHIVFVVRHGEVLRVLRWAGEGMPLSVAAARCQCAPLRGAQTNLTLGNGSCGILEFREAAKYSEYMVSIGVHLLIPSKTRRKRSYCTNMHNKIRLRRCPPASIVTNDYEDRCIHCNTNFNYTHHITFIVSVYFKC